MSNQILSQGCLQIFTLCNCNCVIYFALLEIQYDISFKSLNLKVWIENGNNMFTLPHKSYTDIVHPDNTRRIERLQLIIGQDTF